MRSMKQGSRANMARARRREEAMSVVPFSVAACRELALLAESDDTISTTYAWRTRYAADVPALCDEIDQLREQFERLRLAIKTAEMSGKLELDVAAELLGEVDARTRPR